MASVETSVQARLTAICGEAHVLSHPHELATYRSDGLKHL
jgi:hypothetical protein